MRNQAIISIILLQNVETFVPEFIEILSEFDKSKLLGMRLHPPPPTPLLL